MSDLVFETVDGDVICLEEQQKGISAANPCRIKGGSNKCPAGSTLNYAGERNTVDADVYCPLDSVAQSDWIQGSQKGLCDCSAVLLDEACGVINEEMDCECVACPFGMKLGFAYSCTTEIVGPCKSFDCFGRCNQKYDPGNLVGDKETFAPTKIEDVVGSDPAADGSSSPYAKNCAPGNHLIGTVVTALALFRMIF